MSSHCSLFSQHEVLGSWYAPVMLDPETIFCRARQPSTVSNVLERSGGSGAGFVFGLCICIPEGRARKIRGGLELFGHFKRTRGVL